VGKKEVAMTATKRSVSVPRGGKSSAKRGGTKRKTAKRKTTKRKTTKK
jgi:hypothetical protein